ncbi:hypothetical protein GCM10023231_20360 [Olivibacter ginsenosidimutans]|uniref:Lipocalin-like domain-containing protein n=1 Tax=Olivibacter ginsenosidimutans TaxID=1176537 RepID=A0ABP9B8W8_9SPHI
MKTAKLVFKTMLTILLISAMTISCSKKNEDEPIPTDPVIGTWKLRAIYSGGSATDVTDKACFKDSYLKVDEKMMNLTLSAPNSTTEACQTQNLSVEWLNENGTYYWINNNEKSPADFSLNDNNETLQLNITSAGEQVSLIFRK